jgi:hypothetical protein
MASNYLQSCLGLIVRDIFVEPFRNFQTKKHFWTSKPEREFFISKFLCFPLHTSLQPFSPEGNDANENLKSYFNHFRNSPTGKFSAHGEYLHFRRKCFRKFSKEKFFFCKVAPASENRMTTILFNYNFFSPSLYLVVFRVARWYIFKPKFPIWVNFGRSCKGRCYYILWPFGLFYGHMVYFVAIWYI